MARKGKGDSSQVMFRDPSGQERLFDKSLQEEIEAQARAGIECLGQTFPSEAARREHFSAVLRRGLEELHAKLAVPFVSVGDAAKLMQSIEQWPMGDAARMRDMAERMRLGEPGKDLLQRWKDEVGFPHGLIDDIVRLSDPPYFTACPNPFTEEFVRRYGRPYDPAQPYSKEPFAADVSEGKSDSIYNAHSYHTKVPHKAIMRYILHYTQPGDVVLDGFCGTGMTGVAAQLCGDKAAVESLGLTVGMDGQVLDTTGSTVSRLGARKSVLNDLSPAATFIAANYTTPVNLRAFEREADRILNEIAAEYGWMYETQHTDGKTKGRISYTVWSEVFACPHCSGEITFLDEALEEGSERVKDAFPCPHCHAAVGKSSLDKVHVTVFDPILRRTRQTLKRIPVLIEYKVGGEKHKKRLDEFDKALNERIAQMPVPSGLLSVEFPYMHMTHERVKLANYGVTHIHHLFFPRTAHILTALWQKALEVADPHVRAFLLFAFEQAIWGMSLQNRYGPTHFSQVNRILSGVYYISSLMSEVSPWYVLDGKIDRLIKAFSPLCRQAGWVSVTTMSAAALDLPPNSIDYIFTDPPFGENIYYSDLNFIVESWHKVITNSQDEAIVDKAKHKALPEYQSMMRRAFANYCRVLKPGRWMTVEFHNSHNAVWNAIQEALLSAGFVVADVRTLDKQQSSYRQVTAASAAKQDLVISAYRPNGGLEERFKVEAGTDEGAWDFIRTHLRQLPVFVAKGGKAESVAERQSFMLFDRMVAFHIQRGVSVPLSTAEFYAGLGQRFIERDSMYFLPHQAAEYDRKRATVEAVEQLELIPRDEESAIRWLRQELKDKPRTFQDLSPQFMREIGGWQKFERPLELRELLEQNFLCYGGDGDVPSQIHAYLSSNFKELRKVGKNDAGLTAKAKDRWYVPDPNKLADLEKLREKDLLKEFEEYRQSKQKKLKVFRLEAFRAGFKAAYDRQDYGTIVEMAAKIPETVLQEDEKLLMYYDVATMRAGDGEKDRLF